MFWKLYNSSRLIFRRYFMCQVVASPLSRFNPNFQWFFIGATCVNEFCPRSFIYSVSAIPGAKAFREFLSISFAVYFTGDGA